MTTPWKHWLLIAGLAVAPALTANFAAAQSAGYMRMPSTLAQYCGCGYGAGHHVPIVRTPLQRPDRVQRMTLVAPCEGSMHPAAYAPIGCYGGACTPYEHWEYPAPSAVMSAPLPPAPALPAATPMAPGVGAATPQPVPAAPIPPPDRAAWRMVLP